MPPTQSKTEPVVPKKTGSLVEAAAAANAGGGCEKHCCPAYVMPVEGDPLKFTTATELRSIGQFPAAGKEFPHMHFYMKDKLRNKVRAADNLPFGSAGPSESYDPRCSFVAKVLGGTDNAETNSFFLEHNILSHPDETMGHVCYFPPEIGNVSYDENTCSTANAHLYNEQFKDVVDVEGKFGKGEAIRIVMHDGPEPMSRRPMCQIRFNKDLAERPDGHERMAAYMRFLYNAAPERQFWRENTTWLFNTNLEEAYKNLRAAKEIEDLRGDLKKQSAATQSLEAERAGFLKDPHKFMNTFMDSRLGVAAKDKTGFDSSLEFAKSAASHIPYSGDNIDLKKGAWGVGKHVALLSDPDPAKVLTKWSGWTAPGSSADQDKEKGERASRLAAHITKSAEFDSVWDRKVDTAVQAAEAKRKADKCATILPTGYKERKTADGNSVACTYRDGKEVTNGSGDCASSFKADCTWANVPDPKKPESCDWALGTSGTGPAAKFNCQANGELYGAAGIKTYMNRLDATNKVRSPQTPGTSKQLDDYLSAAAETGKFNPGFTRDEGNKCIYKNLSQDGCFAVQSGKCDKPAVVNLVGGGSRKLLEGKTTLTSTVARASGTDGVNIECSYPNKDFKVHADYLKMLAISEDPKTPATATCAPKGNYAAVAKCDTSSKMACVTKGNHVTETITKQEEAKEGTLPNITFSAAAPITCDTLNNMSVKPDGKCTPNEGYGVFQKSTVFPKGTVRSGFETKLEIDAGNACGPKSDHNVYKTSEVFLKNGTSDYYTLNSNSKTFEVASPCGNETTLRGGQCVSTKECGTQLNYTLGDVNIVYKEGPGNNERQAVPRDNYSVHETAKVFFKGNGNSDYYTLNSNSNTFEVASPCGNETTIRDGKCVSSKQCTAPDYKCPDGQHRNSSGQCVETPKAGSGCTQEFTRSGISNSNHYTLDKTTFRPRDDLYAKISGGQPVPLYGDTPYKLNETSRTMQVASLPGCIQSYRKVESSDPQPKINFNDIAYTLRSDNGQGVFTSGRCATPTNTTQYTKQSGDTIYYELSNYEFQIRNTTQIKQRLGLYEKDTITFPDPVGSRQAYVANENNRTFVKATCPTPDYSCQNVNNVPHHRNSSGQCIPTPTAGPACIQHFEVNYNNGIVPRIGHNETAYTLGTGFPAKLTKVLTPLATTCSTGTKPGTGDSLGSCVYDPCPTVNGEDIYRRNNAGSCVKVCGDNLYLLGDKCVPYNHLHIVSKNVKYSKDGEQIDSKWYQLGNNSTHFMNRDPCDNVTAVLDTSTNKCKIKPCNTGEYRAPDGSCKAIPAATTQVTCGPGTKKGTGNDSNKCVPECPEGHKAVFVTYERNGPPYDCVPVATYGTGTKAGTTPNSCVPECPEGQKLSGNSCVPICGTGTEWISAEKVCKPTSTFCGVRCPEGETFFMGRCGSVCGPGTKWNVNEKQCKVESSVCGAWTEWDTSLLKCVPKPSGTRVIAVVTTNSWSQENGNGRWTVHKGGDTQVIWEADVNVWLNKTNSNLNGDVDGVYVAEGYVITFSETYNGGTRTASLDPADQGGHGVWNINGQSSDRKGIIQKAQKFRVTKK